jgi:hypothetical protein
LHKAAAVAQLPDCLSNMPELLMAWFYAGFHAGSLNHSSSSSGGGGGDAHQQQQQQQQCAELGSIHAQANGS